MANYQGMVMLYHPPFDKVAAKVVIERHLDQPLPVIEFYGNPVCSPEKMLEWEQKDLFPIDIGDEKYNRSQFGSATEVVVNLLGFQPSPTEYKLIEMLRKNNQTGYLKSFHLSIVWLIREMYELNGYEQTEIIERAGKVVRFWLEAQEQDKTSSQNDWIPDELSQSLAKCQDAPFTVGRLVRDMTNLGYSPDSIYHEIQWWLKAADEMAKEMAAAKEEYEAIPKIQFDAGQFRGTALDTVSYFVSKVAARETDVLLVRRYTGHTAVLSRGLELSALATELKRLEPERWYYHQRPGQVINGGKIYGGQECGASEPSSLSLDELIKLVQKFPPRNRRRENPSFQQSRRFTR